MLISKNQKKYPPLSFLFLSPWPSDSLAVSDCFHSANTLPLAKRMLFTMSMMLGIGYSRLVMPSIWQVLIVSPNSMRSMILYGIWLSLPHGMYFILSLMMTVAMSCSSLKTSDVLEVKAAEASVLGMVWTDVGGMNEKSLISCFFKAKI